MKNRAKKKVWGYLPASCKDYAFVGTVDYEKKVWELYAGLVETESDWRNFRIFVKGTITGRANYRIAWNSAQKRFAKCHDLQALQEKRPMLFRMIFELLQKTAYIEIPY